MEFFFSVVISSIGLAYFVYGKKAAEFLFMLIGLILMFYPYFIRNLTFSIVIGIFLTICPLVLKRV